MAAYFYEWTQNLAYYMVLVTIAMQMIPNGVYKKYVRFFTGLLLIVLIAGPILRVFDMKDSFWNFYYGTTQEQRRKEIEDATKYLEGISIENLWEDG